ncbi:MAG: ACT domain-containing protein [Blastocatellia bacterium]
MPLNSEEIIYTITRIVYERLGEKAESSLVEALVTDIFSALKPSLISKEKSVSHPVQYSNQKKPTVEPSSPTRYIISVFGLDQPGIVALVATLLGDANCSIIDMNQTVVQGKFAMIMIIDASRATQDMGKLREEFRTAGDNLGVRIYMQREDIFQAMHRV